MLRTNSISESTMQPVAHILKNDILLVEDYAPNALVATAMFEILGHRCTTVENGAQALDLLHRKKFDLILMDLQMPVMDGLETTRRIRAFEHEKSLLPTSIVAMTANVSDADRMRCAEVGMNGFLAKPFTSDTLAEMVRNFISPGLDD